MNNKFKYIFLVLLLVLFSFFHFTTNNVTAYASNDANNYSVANANYNIVCYDFETKETSFLYFNNSVAAAENEASNSNINNTMALEDEPTEELVENTLIAPYKYVCNVSYIDDKLRNHMGTAFFIGANVLLTSAHNIYNSSKQFVPYLLIRPGQYGSNSSATKPLGVAQAKKVYLPKEYYLNPDTKSNGENYENDWAAILIDRDSEVISAVGGNFGKIANFSTINENVTTLGYKKEHMWAHYGTTKTFYEDKVVCNLITSSGNSGSPILIKRNGNDYVIGILSGGDSATKLGLGPIINSFIYLFTNSLLANNGIEVKDYYIKEKIEVKYNCVVKVIIDPIENGQIYLSSNGIDYTRSVSALTEEFYATGTNTTVGQIPYDYYKTYYSSSNTFSSIRRITTTHSTDEISALYKLKTRSSTNAIIETGFDKESNVWKHGGKKDSIIKGSIVYNNQSKNIEVTVPFLGTNTSSEVTIDDRVFQLRCGPNKVSIKVNKKLNCTENTVFFAFAVV